MNNLDLPNPKRIDESMPLNLACGYSLELGKINEDFFQCMIFMCLLDQLKPTESVIDVWMLNDYNQGHVSDSLNISLGNEQVFIEEI